MNAIQVTETLHSSLKLNLRAPHKTSCCLLVPYLVEGRLLYQSVFKMAACTLRRLCQLKVSLGFGHRCTAVQVRGTHWPFSSRYARKCNSFMVIYFTGRGQSRSITSKSNVIFLSFTSVFHHNYQITARRLFNLLPANSCFGLYYV